jgi:hypothetical protein
MKPGFYCALNGRIDGGGAGDTGQWPATMLAVSKQRRGGADLRKGMVPTCGPGRSAGERGKKGGAGRCELLGHGLLRGPRGEGKKKREGEKRGVWVFFCFQNLFKPFSTFQTLNSFKTFQDLNSFPKFKHFKPFQNVQNNFKTFKTSHKQTIKPCIQIMMHKHLLLLTY